MQILKAGRSAADCVAYYKAYNPRKTVTLTILKRFFFILLFSGWQIIEMDTWDFFLKCLTQALSF